MSDTLKSLIPCNPHFVPTAEQAKAIEAAVPRCLALTCFETMQFADAGSNFESVCCPFCNTELMGWWGGAMDAAYNKETGFANLEVKTPCCGRDTTLNDLRYHFPQGFYMARLAGGPDDTDIGDEDALLKKLLAITGAPWRIIAAHY